MDVMGWIVVWGVTALAACVAGGIVARAKNRDSSGWAGWCFLLPPLVLLLFFLPARERPRPRKERSLLADTNADD
jgi:drug/metabolite transporter (DMT)-like permease